MEKSEDEEVNNEEWKNLIELINRPIRSDNMIDKLFNSDL